MTHIFSCFQDSFIGNHLKCVALTPTVEIRRQFRTHDDVAAKNKPSASGSASVMPVACSDYFGPLIHEEWPWTASRQTNSSGD